MARAALNTRSRRRYEQIILVIAVQEKVCSVSCTAKQKVANVKQKGLGNRGLR